MKTIAIDNETFLITRNRPLPPVVCMSWCDGDKSAVIPHTDLYGWIWDKLTTPEIGFVGHNIAYDFGTLAASEPDLLPHIFSAYAAGRVTDTLIRQQLFDIAVGRTFADEKVRIHSLASLYELCFDRAMPGGPKKSILENTSHVRYNYGRLYGVDFSEWPDESIEYARNDAVCTYEIYQEQQKAAHLLRDDTFQAYSAFCLSLTSAQGMRTDAGCVRTFKANQTAVMQAIEPELAAEGMIAPKWKGRGDAKRQDGWIKKMDVARNRIAAVCEEKGIKPLMTKPKNPGAVPQIAIDRTACHHANDPLMLRRAEYSTAEKMLSTYVPFLEAGADGPVTSWFNLAATGRTTSSTPRDPAVGGNMQNAPRKTKELALNGTDLVDSLVGVRECFTPRPGRIFLSGDFSGAEMHGVAQVCKWKLDYSTLGEVLNAGRDAHLFLAAYLLGGNENDYDDVRARYEQEDPQVITARHEAKKGNFGFWGGMGVVTFIKIQLREGFHWSKVDATRLRQAWMNAYPEALPYFEANKTELGPGGAATVEFYWSKRLRKVRGFPTICNGWFQAIVAEREKKACNAVIKRYTSATRAPLTLFTMNSLRKSMTERRRNSRPPSLSFEARSRANSTN